MPNPLFWKTGVGDFHSQKKSKNLFFEKVFLSFFSSRRSDSLLKPTKSLFFENIEISYYTQSEGFWPIGDVSGRRMVSVIVVVAASAPTTVAALKSFVFFHLGWLNQKTPPLKNIFGGVFLDSNPCKSPFLRILKFLTFLKPKVSDRLLMSLGWGRVGVIVFCYRYHCCAKNPPKNGATQPPPLKNIFLGGLFGLETMQTPFFWEYWNFLLSSRQSFLADYWCLWVGNG